MINTEKIMMYIENSPFLLGFYNYIYKLKYNKWFISFIIIEIIAGCLIYLRECNNYDILKGGFPTILSSIIAIDIAVIAIWLPIVIIYKQKEFGNHFIIKNFSESNNTVSKAVIDLFNLNNLYYNFILSISASLIILYLGMIVSEKMALFLLFSAILMFGIVTIGQIIALYKLVKNLEPNNVRTLILTRAKKDINLLNKTKGYKDGSRIFNNCLEYTDLLISNFCIEVFRNKEMETDLKITNILFLLYQALYIRQKISELLYEHNMIDPKYVWFKQDILKDNIKVKLQNQSGNYFNIKKVINTIYKDENHSEVLFFALAEYEFPNLKHNEFPLAPFVINLIDNNTQLIEDLKVQTIGKEVPLSTYDKLILNKGDE